MSSFPPKRGGRRTTLSRAAHRLTFGWSDSPRGNLALRRASLGFVAAMLRLRSHALPIKGNLSVLVISPHPDDETFGCGGTLSVLAQNNASIRVAFISDGSASHPDHPVVSPSGMADVRSAEARLATAALGVSAGHLRFIGAPDGTLGRLTAMESERVIGKLAEIMGAAAPQIILVPCRSDGSSEHEAAFPMVLQALQASGTKARILEFAVWSWWNPLLLLRHAFGYKRVWRIDIQEVRKAKERAIAAYVSQTLPIPPDRAASLPPGFAAMFVHNEEFLFER
jgi:N-acetylglucosamine malate deacetylase 1